MSEPIHDAQHHNGAIMIHSASGNPDSNDGKSRAAVEETEELRRLLKHADGAGADHIQSAMVLVATEDAEKSSAVNSADDHASK